MYTQIFFVTSVRGIVVPPQMAANAGLRVFGAKMPFPAFFMAATFFLADADRAFFPAVFFSAVIFFNTYVSAIAYAQTWRYVPFINGHLEEGASTEEEMPYADYEVEPENRGEALDNFSEYALTSAMYDAFIENATAFQSSQMSAMENATSNANEMIESLSLRYNRARQAKITTELCEIISGASAV